MPRVENNPSQAVTATTYQEVRQSFLVRLQTEHDRLQSLGEALAATEGVPANSFEELERFAHRLRGAAAVFKVPELHDAAKVLELAASGALERRASNNDLHLRSSMRMLAASLVQAGQGTSDAG